MTVLEAAKAVLKEAEKPLHAKEIAKRILEKKLWESSGKTPDQTITALLYTDVKKKGDASTFILVSPMVFSLRDKTSAPQDHTSPALPKKKGPAPKKKSNKTYSFTDAAEKILELYGKKNPMHYKAVTEKALELGWLNTEGKTPEATMYAQVITEIRKKHKRGEQPRFVQHGKGYFGLSKWMGHGLAFEIEQYNKKVSQALHKKIHSLTPSAFEELIAQLLTEIGFEDIEVTSRSKDGGIDVRGTLVVGDVIRTRMAIQAKKWKRNVQAQIVQQVRGSLGTHEQGLIVTTSDFSSGARKEAARPDAIPVALMNGEQLVILLIENNIGVTRRNHELFELNEIDDLN